MGSNRLTNCSKPFFLLLLTGCIVLNVVIFCLLWLLILSFFFMRPGGEGWEFNTIWWCQLFISKIVNFNKFFVLKPFLCEILKVFHVSHFNYVRQQPEKCRLSKNKIKYRTYVYIPLWKHYWMHVKKIIQIMWAHKKDPWLTRHGKAGHTVQLTPT